MHDTVNSILSVLLPILVPILLAAVVTGVSLLAKKVGIDLSAGEIALVRSVAMDGVLFAEQRAKITATPSGEAPMGAADKKKIAIEFAEKILRAKGVSEGTIAMLDHFLEAAVGGLNFGGAKAA